MELNEIVMKLVGPVQPVGDSREDERRLANMKAPTELLDHLLQEVGRAANCEGRHESSMRVIGLHARQFLRQL
jgi:hypothetical protein